MKDEVIYSVQDFADMFKISKNTVYAMIKRGDLQAYQISNKIRISSEEVEAYKKRSLKSGKNTKSKSVQSFVISGYDTALNILAHRLQQKGFEVSRVFQNSMASLNSLQQEKVQVAATHMWNSETNKYNIDYVKGIFPEGGVVLFRLFNRMQGFYVQKGNPKNIKNWSDLRNANILLIKREFGSGADKLLDLKLREYGINANNINYCSDITNSTFELVQAIAEGKADVGLDKACTLFSDKVDFIPLQRECYDLAIKEENWNKDFSKELYNIVCSKEYQQEITSVGSYDISEIGHIIMEGNKRG